MSLINNVFYLLQLTASSLSASDVQLLLAHEYKQLHIIDYFMSTVHSFCTLSSCSYLPVVTLKLEI